MPFPTDDVVVRNDAVVTFLRRLGQQLFGNRTVFFGCEAQVFCYFLQAVRRLRCERNKHGCSKKNQQKTEQDFLFSHTRPSPGRQPGCR